MNIGSLVNQSNVPKGFDVGRHKKALWDAGIPESMHARLIKSWLDYIEVEGKFSE